MPHPILSASLLAMYNKAVASLSADRIRRERECAEVVASHYASQALRLTRAINAAESGNVAGVTDAMRTDDAQIYAPTFEVVAFEQSLFDACLKAAAPLPPSDEPPAAVPMSAAAEPKPVIHDSMPIAELEPKRSHKSKR